MAIQKQNNQKDISGSRIEQLIRIRQGLITSKINFDTQYIQLDNFYYQKGKDIYAGVPNVIEGQPKDNSNINDNTGIMAARAMASALMGMTWKNKSNTFRMKMSRNFEINEEEKAYFVRVNNDFSAYMERPKARYEIAHFKTLMGFIVYGTSGTGVQSGGYADPLKYQNHSIKSFYVGYNKDGEIDTMIIDYPISAQELFDKYGEKAGGSVLDAVNAQDYTKRFVVSEFIAPRRNPTAKAGKLSMPFSSETFMFEQQIVLEVGGYNSLPIKTIFYDKLEWESYGRGPCMDALPTVVQNNINTELLSVGSELTVIPTLGMFDNGSLSGKNVELSAGALTVFNVTGGVPAESPIFPLFQTGDLRILYEWSKELKEQIGFFFLLDKLYDLNAKQRMTLGEAVMRNEIRSDSLTPILVNILSHQTEVIDRSADILYGMGLLGVKDPNNLEDPIVKALLENGYQPFKIPDRIFKLQQSGADWYEIDFISPASRIMNTEDLTSSVRYIELMATLSGVDSDFSDVMDPDGTSEKLQQLLKADNIMVRPLEIREERRKARQELQAQQMQIQNKLLLAQANQAEGQGAMSRATAGSQIQNAGI